MGGAGGALSQPVPEAQSRTYCLSKDGWPRPGAYPSAGQKREESGVQTSSPSVSSRRAPPPPGAQPAPPAKANLELRAREDPPALAGGVGAPPVDGDGDVAQAL